MGTDLLIHIEVCRDIREEEPQGQLQAAMYMAIPYENWMFSGKWNSSPAVL